MNKEKKLTEIIIENDFCLTRNPYGSKRSWPNSFIEKFYDPVFQKLFLYNKTPNILEINQRNSINLELWEIFFNNVKVDKFDINTNNKDNIVISKDYDIIILNNYENIFTIKYLKKFSSVLKNNGMIIIENISEKLFSLVNLYIKTFFIYNINIYDFRSERFVLSNCLLVLKNDPKIFTREKFKSLVNLFKFVLFELIIKVSKIIINCLRF
tara:strand:- start:8442 stop:9074 length:633 start_codon:yes stop_codon:yes gene_type:complete